MIRRLISPATWLVLAFLSLWQVAAWANDLLKLHYQGQGQSAAPVDWGFLSSPIAVILALPIELGSGQLGPAMLGTLWHTAVAATLAFGIAFGIAQGIHSSDLVRRATMPVLRILGGIPPVTLLPVFLLVFGLDAESVIALAVFGACISSVFGCVDALDSTPRELPLALRKLGYSTLGAKLWIATLLGGRLASAAREALRWSLILSVVGEMHGSVAGGLGSYIDRGRLNQAYASVFLGVIACGFAAIVLGRLLKLVIANVQGSVQDRLLGRPCRLRLVAGSDDL